MEDKKKHLITVLYIYNNTRIIQKKNLYMK